MVGSATVSFAAGSTRPRSEFLRVLRRIENAAATMRAKRAGSGIGNGSETCGTSLATAESTAGGGWNAPRPTRKSGSTRHAAASMTVSRP